MPQEAPPTNPSQRPLQREECHKIEPVFVCDEFYDSFSSSELRNVVETYKCATGIGTRRMTSILPYAEMRSSSEASIREEAAL